MLVLFLLFSCCLLAGYARDIRASRSFDATQCVLHSCPVLCCEHSELCVTGLLNVGHALCS